MTSDVPQLWRGARFRFAFPRPTLVMGIVNVTPDSFSDGGQYVRPEAAIAHALELVQEGADLLDIGGESTRPGAIPVPEEEEELRRVLPVFEGLRGKVEVPLSIDTYKPRVAEAALRAGAGIVNDVGAAWENAAMTRVVAEHGAGYVAMHAQGTPTTMQQAPRYHDVVAEVNTFFSATLERLAAAGVAREQVALDVGIGFGKTLEHNLELLGRMAAFREQQRPLLLGVSRKSVIANVTGAAVTARLPGALAATVLAVEQGVGIVRTHDVAATVQALRMTEAIRGRRQAHS